MTAITIRDFMGAAEHGRVSIANFLAGFLELMKQLQLFPPNPIPVEGEEEQNTLPRNSQLQTASDCFSRLVLGIITFQIRSDAVLHTKFMCEMKETENDTRNDLQSCLLYRGVSALYRALHKPDRGRFKEIQVHSDIWFAVHFSCRSPSRDSELNPVLLESAHTGVSDNDNTVAWDFLEKLPKLSNRESSQVPHNLTDFLSLGTGAHEYVKLASDPGPYNPIFAWNIVLHWILHGFPASSGVHLIMHPANLHIAQILTEWWSGKIDDVSIPMQFFKDLEIAIFHGRIVGLEAPRDYQDDMMRLWLYEFWFTSSKLLDRTVRYRYRRRASRSAAIQRLSRAVYKGTLDDLNIQFRDIAPDNIPLGTQMDSQPENNGNALIADDKVEEFKAEARTYGGSGSFYKPEEMTPAEVQRLTDMTTHELGYASGAILNSYPWEDYPKFPEVRGDKPYFLWDRKSRRTLKAENLPDDVQYTAISHTWGRWRKPTPAVSVTGVEGWKIPENTRFDVKSLPEMLAQVPCDTDYLWFDLVCIPQDEPALDELAKREIGRQGMIFTRAKATIAWFSDVEGWNGVQAAILQFSVDKMKRLGHLIPDGVVELLRNEHQRPLELYSSKILDPKYNARKLPDETIVWEINPFAATLEDVAKSSEEILEELVSLQMKELMAKIQNKPGVASDAELDMSEESLELPSELTQELFPNEQKAWSRMNSWFSSLWTLQEVCICPHMWLCDKSWRLLTITPSQDMKVELDSLIVIGASFGHHFSPPPSGSTAEEWLEASSEDLGLALRSLRTLVRDTGLDQLQIADRTTILALANRRQCRSRRAEAIMSAVGITDWYNKQFDSETLTMSAQLSKSGLSTQTTSLGDYPEAFVKEAAEKIGAIFYSSTPCDDEVLWWLSQGDSATLSASQGLGSMFPFTRYPSQRRYDSYLGIYFTFGHSTVDGWVISGHSVEIREAAILSYTGQQERSGTRNQGCSIDGLNIYKETIMNICFTHLPLDEWVDTFLPTTRNFAVCVLVGPLWIFGILLKELSSGDLIKIGTFSVRIGDAKFDIKTYKVKWRVL